MTETEVAVAMPPTAVASVTGATGQVAKFEADAVLLKEFTRGILSLADEAKLVFGPEGLSAKLVDPAHVAMIQVRVPKESFLEYEADGVQIVPALDNVAEFVKLAKKGQTIRFGYEADANKLVARIGNVTRRFSVTDPDSIPDPKVPTLHLPASAVVAAEDLLDAFKASGAVSDHICLATLGGKLVLTASGDTDTVTVPLSKAEGDAKSLFSLDYFEKIIKAAPKGAAVRLELGVEYPVRIQWTANGAQYEALLAPRIESD